MSRHYDPVRAGQEARVFQFKRLVSLIKALRGEVYGECVRDLLLLVSDANQESCMLDRIRCRMGCRAMAQTLLSVMRVDFHVQCVNYIDSVEASYRVYLSGPAAPQTIQLDVTTMSYSMWRLQRLNFDVDNLASSSRSLFVWSLFGSNPMSTAQVHCTEARPSNPGHLIETLARIHQRRFSLLGEGSCTIHLDALMGAIDMVQSGWTHDSSRSGNWDIWIMAAPEVPTLDVPTPDVPTLDVPAPDAPTCAICQDPLKQGDCVVRLPCKHVFHGHCDAANKRGGICQWLRINGSCPYCRCPCPVRCPMVRVNVSTSNEEAATPDE